MKNKTSKIGWILVNSFSNQYKIDRIKQDAEKNGQKIVFVLSNDFYLRNNINGSVELINVKDNQVAIIPDYAISLIPDEKNDPMAYKILEFLESQSVKLLNSVKSIRLATDKFQSNILLSKNKIETPETKIFSKKSNNILSEFPFIIKPIDGRKGRGVELIDSQKKLDNYLKSSEELSLIIQELISESFGKDIRVFILDGKYIGSVRRDRVKNGLSNFITWPIKLEQKLIDKAITISKLHGLNFCCVDLFVDKGNTVCEVNANPGYKNFEKYISKNLPSLILNYLEKNLN